MIGQSFRVAFAVFCLASLAAAQERTDFPTSVFGSRRIPETRYEIQGTIRFSENFHAADRVRVVLVSFVGPVVQETLTDPGGNFVFRNISPGQYLIRAFAPGYKTAETSVVINNVSAQGVLLVFTERDEESSQRAGAKGAAIVIPTEPTRL